METTTPVQRRCREFPIGDIVTLLTRYHVVFQVAQEPLNELLKFVTGKERVEFSATDEGAYGQLEDELRDQGFGDLVDFDFNQFVAGDVEANKVVMRRLEIRFGPSIPLREPAPCSISTT